MLRCRNATQTSIVLEWDPIQLATSTLRSLALYRNGSKAGNIPRPLDMLSTKMSGLSLNTEYSFFLVLRTSGGTYTSNTLTVKTHAMENLTGITVTPGVLPPALRESLDSAVDRIGAKIADTVRIDTTHFVCTEPRGDAWQKAVDMNIPVVRSEWLEGCEREGKLVGVRAYYLDADPKLRQVGANPSIQHQSRDSMAGDTRTLPGRTSSIQQGQANLSQASLPHRDRGPKSSDKEGGEPGPTVGATPELQQGETPRQKDKDLPPDPPKVDDEEDASDDDNRPEDPEKQRPQESEEESEEEKENTQVPQGKGKKAEVENEKGEDMEDVVL